MTQPSALTAADDLRKNWDKFCDADHFDGSDTFIERMEAEGLIELVSVTADALADPFAAERGIERGSYMWQLTNAGRAALEGPEGDKP